MGWPIGLGATFAAVATALATTLAVTACSSHHKTGATGGDAGADDGGGDDAAGDALSDGGGPPGDGGTVPQSSADLITAALQNGQIDEKTWALYELLAQYSPQRLPQQFAAQAVTNDLPSVTPALVARQHMAEYDATQAAAVNAMLAQPSDPNWLGFPSGMPLLGFVPGDDSSACYSAFGFDEGKPSPQRYLGAPFPTPKGHFAIYPMAPGSLTAADESTFRTRIQNALAAPTPKVGGSGSETFAEYLDEVYDAYVSAGMAPPTTLPAETADGGTTGTIPIYLAVCDGATNAAAASPAGFIFASVGLALQDEPLRRVVLPHETFHIFEFALGIDASTDNSWPYEASAVAMEDVVAPDVRRWNGAYASSPDLPPKLGRPMDRMFQCPEEPLHWFMQGSCWYRSASPSGARHYSSEYSRFVLMKYLLRNTNYTMSSFWTQYKMAGGDPSGLISDGTLTNLHMALLGDAAGKAWFDPADRTAMIPDGGTANDLATSDGARYTYRLRSDAITTSLIARAAPGEDSSDATNGVHTLDTAAEGLSIEPHAAHRLLFPMKFDAMQPNDANGYWFHIVVSFTAPQQMTWAALVLGTGDDPQGPARTYARSGLQVYSSNDFPQQTSISKDSMLSQPIEFSLPQGGQLPDYVMLVLVNASTSPVDYRASITFEATCIKSCVDHYTTALGSCPMQSWCTNCGSMNNMCACNLSWDYVGNCSTATCQTYYTKNLPAMLGDGANNKQILPVCPMMCGGLVDGWSASRPLDMCPQGNPDLVWCKMQSADMGYKTSDPMGFMTFSQWPDYACGTISL